MTSKQISPQKQRDQFKKLLSKANKLSNKGWSFNHRLIKMDESSLAYYRNVPKDFDENTLKCPSAESEEIKPKQSLPLKRIKIIDFISEDDKKKYKKLTKASDVVFHKNAVVKGVYKVPCDANGIEIEEEDEEEEEEEEEVEKGDVERTTIDRSRRSLANKSKSKSAIKSKVKNYKTWYFICETKFQQELWVKYLVHNVTIRNPKLITSEEVQYLIEQQGAKQKKNLPSKEVSPFNQQELLIKQPSNTEFLDTEKSIRFNPKQFDTFQQVANRNQESYSGKFREEDKIQDDELNVDIPDLNQILQQNMNINNVQLDLEGNINDQNQNQIKQTEEEEGEQYYEANQEAREKQKLLQMNIDRYFNENLELQKNKYNEEQKGWDLKFQNYWGYLISADKNLKDQMVLSEKFFDHIGKFRKKAINLVQEIVDELHKPKILRKHKIIGDPDPPNEEFRVFLDENEIIQNEGSVEWRVKDGILFYSEQNIAIKLTYQGEEELYGQTNNASMNRTNMVPVNNTQDTSMINNNQQNKNEDPFLNLKWKRFGREFQSMDIMFDALFLLSKPNSSHKVRVPLSVLVDYKGFRAIAIANIPIQPQLGAQVGFNTVGKYIPHDQKLKQELLYVGDVLNLKENRISLQGQTQFEGVPISFFLKVYGYQQPVKDNQSSTIENQNKKSQDFHFTELQYLEEPFYVLKTSEIFPYDIDLNEVYPRKDKYLRPEFLCSYERPLKSDTRKEISLNDSKETKIKDEENDQVELNEASRYLKNTVIPNLVALLDSLTIIPVDSESLEMTLHSQGVNMRYLGLVANLSIVPHVKDLCICEMIARTCKNILNKQIASMVMERYEQDERLRIQIQSKYQYQNKGFSKFNDKQIEEQVKRELAEELRKKDDMNDIIKIGIVDYLNLVFGVGEETTYFWNSLILPNAASYYNYPLEELQKTQMNLNAIFFSFSYLFGLNIVRNTYTQSTELKENASIAQKQLMREEDFFKKFGKVDQPFGKPEENYMKIDIVSKCKTYGLRNLPYKLLADKHKEYKTEGKIENALKCCKMKRLMTKLIEDKEDIGTIADVCEIALEQEKQEIAREQAEEALKHIHQYHAEAIKFYCILMRAFFQMDNQLDSDKFFSLALKTLDHHWGPYHPLHTNIYSILAYLLLSKNKMEEAKYLYQSSLLCCLRVLGPNHIQTAEVYMDFGRLYLKMKNKDESLQNFEQAYLIYESYFGKNALPSANAAMQLATILEEQGKLNKAYEKILIASETYANIYGESCEITIIAMWLKLSIAYQLKKKHEDVKDQCKQLFNCIVKREKAQESLQKFNDQIQDYQQQELEEKIKNIKELCIAATILQITRNLNNDEKQSVKKFCETIQFQEMQQNTDDENAIAEYSKLHQKGIDPHRIMSLNNLKFDEISRKNLNLWFEQTKDLKYGFVEYFQQKIDSVKSQSSEKKNANKPAINVKTTMNTAIEPNIFNEYLQNDVSTFFLTLLRTFDQVNFYNALIFE